MNHNLNKEISSGKISLLQTATNFLIGFLLSFFSFFLFLKVFNNLWGAFLGVLVNISGSIYILRKKPQSSIKKTLAVGVLVATIITTVLLVILWTTLQSLFTGISS